MIILLLCLLVYAVSKAICDIIHQGKPSVLPKTNWWNRDSWMNKWDTIWPVNFNHWWYFGFYTPQYKEKFMFSSTILVFLTDAWHFFEWVKHRAIHVGLGYLISRDLWQFMVLSFIIFPIFSSQIFHYSYYSLQGKYLMEKYKKGEIGLWFYTLIIIIAISIVIGVIHSLFKHTSSYLMTF